MPNWCHNKLAITGAREAVIAFIEKVTGTDADGESSALTFTAHVPEPDNIEEYIPPADSMWGRLGDLGWHPWRMEHWGTKWDANTHGAPGWVIGGDHAQLDGEQSAWAVTDEGASIDFETAWSPPGPWLVKVAELEPLLSFVLRWAEPGNDAAGEVRAHGTDVEVLDLEVSDVLPPEEMWF